MKYHVLVDGEHYEVEVLRESGGFRISLGDESHYADVGTLRDGYAYSLVIDDRSVDIGVEERGDTVSLLIAGGRYPAEVLGEREWIARSIQGTAAEGDMTVRANMTGIVREVLVQPGDVVEIGTTLFILEAMKMENEVKAEAAGTVASISVTAGATVSVGDVVVEIE